MIDFEKFLSWAESRFDDIVVSGDEVKVNSIYCEDHKQHMWCNPYGGKKGLPNGVFHCWKTDKSGSLITLIMQVDKCGYDDALEILGGADTSLAELEKKVEELFASKVVVQEKEEEITLKLPDQTFPIFNLPESNFFRTDAEIYLLTRKLPARKFMVCVGGDFKNRVVIPYYDKERHLIYFNARYLGRSKKVPKYLGPDKKYGVGKGDVIYMTRWPKLGSKVYFTEGEFDAESIALTGLNAGAFGGKNVTGKQVELIRGYEPVICFDEDEAGKEALAHVGDLLKRKGFPVVRFASPPKQYKDWNELLCKTNLSVLRAYLEKSERVFLDSLYLEV